MKTKIIMMIGVVLASLGLLSGCASTNGWGYPSDCCFYQRAQCGSCNVKPTCVKTPYCNRKPMSYDNCISESCCNYSYTYNCCYRQNYWMQ